MAIMRKLLFEVYFVYLTLVQRIKLMFRLRKHKEIVHNFHKQSAELIAQFREQCKKIVKGKGANGSGDDIYAKSSSSRSELF
jgi:hypothetical protein